MYSIETNTPLGRYIHDFNDYASTKGRYVLYGQISLLAGIAIGIASYLLLAHGIPANHFSMSERIVASVMAGSVVTFYGFAHLRADYANKIPTKLKKTSLDRFFEALIDEKVLEDKTLIVQLGDFVNRYPATNREVFVYIEHRQEPKEIKKAAFKPLFITNPTNFMITHYERPQASGYQLREELIIESIQKLKEKRLNSISNEVEEAKTSTEIKGKILEKLKTHRLWKEKN